MLDPEQNATFRDNYLGVAFDLSKVLFIGTANFLDNIPGPVRDRMEVIEIPGYVEEEKLEIAKRYLVPRQLEATGLKPISSRSTTAALRKIIRDYTREAGVRNLERLIGAVCRHAAMRIAEGTAERIRIEEKDIAAILGAPRFEHEIGDAGQPAGRRHGPRLDARWAATSSSSRRRACPAAASSSSPASSAR